MCSIGLYVSPYNFFVENWLIWVFYSNSGNKSPQGLLLLLVEDYSYPFVQWLFHTFFQYIFLVCGLWSFSSSVSSVSLWLDRFPQTSGSNKSVYFFLNLLIAAVGEAAEGNLETKGNICCGPSGHHYSKQNAQPPNFGGQILTVHTGTASLSRNSGTVRLRNGGMVC